MPGLSYDNGSGNLFLYNGKELQTDVNLYDYGARFYDPTVGRFTTVDPQVEKYDTWSPYLYGANNPIRFVDRHGEGPIEGITGALASIQSFGYGVANAFSSNNTTFQTPSGSVSLVSRVSGDAAFTNGQKAGDALSLVTGAAEVAGGLVTAAGGTAGGVATSPTGAGAVAGAGVAAAGVAVAAHGRNTFLNAARNLMGDNKGRVNASSNNQGSGGGKGKNELKADQEATGDHSTFKRDNNGNIYKYETYEKTTTGHDNPVKRFDGGKPDGSPGADHFNKKTKELIPTPQTQGKNIPGGARRATSDELPNNSRFR